MGGARSTGTDVWGTTWYWGYDNVDQIQGENLVFHSFDGTFIKEGPTDVGDAEQTPTESEQDSLILKAPYTVGQRGRLSYGILGSICKTLIPLSITRETGQTWVLENRYVVDGYYLYGMVPPATAI